MDLDTAIAGCNKKYPIILLAHQPKAAMMAMDSEHDIQLVLSGEWKLVSVEDNANCGSFRGQH